MTEVLTSASPVRRGRATPWWTSIRATAVGDRAAAERDPLRSVAMCAARLDAAILVAVVGVLLWALVSTGYLGSTPHVPAMGAGLIVAWLVAILARGGYDSRFLAKGAEEFKRIIAASATLLAFIGVSSYLAKAAPPLRMIVPSLVVGTLALLVGRWRLRTWLGRRFAEGRFLRRTLIIGGRGSIASLAGCLSADTTSGFRVIGAVRPPTSTDPRAIDAWLDSVMEWVRTRHVHAVAVVESTAVDVEVLRRLSWRLEGPHIDLLVTPVLSDVAGPRVSVRPAAGLPLLRLDEPSLTGPKRVLKRTLDLALTVPALVLLAPLFLAIAVAVKLDSRGPVFYVSQRVGRAGAFFGCLKFRTMRVGADLERAEVIGAPDESIADRYRTDPRITRIGSTLRRWSLDELPQLLNVVGGSMSLVGPRPMLPEEMSLLADADHRRHLTKPGITGLWQISGRKEVAWEDRMRMDLHYIETWSVPLDVVILSRTAKAVVAGQGAY